MEVSFLPQVTGGQATPSLLLYLRYRARRTFQRVSQPPPFGLPPGVPGAPAGRAKEIDLTSETSVDTQP